MPLAMAVLPERNGGDGGGERGGESLRVPVISDQGVDSYGTKLVNSDHAVPRPGTPLTDALIAEEHRVVLRHPAEDLDGPTYLVVPPDHRIQLALLGAGGEVDPVLQQAVVVALGAAGGDAGGPAVAPARPPRGGAGLGAHDLHGGLDVVE